MPSIRPVSAILLAHEAPDFAKLQETWQTRQISPGAVCHKFIILGRFDQLILNLTDEPSALMPPVSGITNARAATSSSYIGRVVAPDEFDPSQWAQDWPVVGLCSVRFSRRILAAAGSFDFLDSFLRQRLAEMEVRHVVISATGWEDALVLFFAKNFNTIAKAAGLVRSMRLDDLPYLKDQVQTDDGFTHPCLTTCTLPAFCCQWNKDWSPAETTELIRRLDADAPLHWAVRLELHPGHWKGCADDLRQSCEKLGLPLPTFRPTFGQTDLRVSATEGPAATHGGLLRFLLDVVFQAGKKRTVIRSAETHLHPEVPDYAEDQQAGPEVDQKKPPSDPDGEARQHEAIQQKKAAMRQKLSASGVPPHTLDALEEMLCRVQGISEDPMHGEEFDTLRRLRKAFAAAIARLSDKIDEEDARQLQLDISEWQSLLERCLGDRFRGSYPAGDSMMMKLGTYQGAHHRFLVVMDAFARQAYEMACATIKSHWSKLALPEVALATFIGNSPSAYATSTTLSMLGCGFTDVPASMVCRMRDAHMLAHETGHHVVRAFFTLFPRGMLNLYWADPVNGVGSSNRRTLEDQGELDAASITTLDRCWKSPAVLREIREMLADYFCISLCFPDGLPQHRAAAKKTLEDFYLGGSKTYLLCLETESRLRSAAIEAFVTDADSAPGAFHQKAEEIIALIEREAAIGIDFSRLRKRRDDMKDGLKALRILRQIRSFGALLKGIRDCAHQQTFPGETPGHSLLEDMRGFLKDASKVTLEENFVFLDKLWFKLLRCRQAGANNGAGTIPG